MFVCMYECIDKKTDECMDVCIHVDECTTFAFMDGLTYVCVDGYLVYMYVCRSTDGCKHG